MRLRYLWHRFCRIPSDVYYGVHSLIFRLRRGFSYRDCWSLDGSVAKWLVPRLRHLAENHAGWHCVFCGVGGYAECEQNQCPEAWTAILFKMAEAFEMISKDVYIGLESEQERYVDEGLDLFREFFFDLWD